VLQGLNWHNAAMQSFITTNFWDLLGFAMCVATIVLYQLYLGWRTRRDPSSSALHGMHAARTAWVEVIMRERRDILSVQTLRNSTMTSSFMASTAVLLIIGVLTLTAQADKLSGTWLMLNVLGHESASMWLLKLLFMLLDLLFAFFSFSLAMRLYHHMGYLLNVGPNCDLECVRPARVAAEFNRAAIFYRYGMRAYFYIVPLLFWLFGTLWMVGATALLIYFLYRLDKAPSSDADLMG
jgi:uncharacterized membrane protein